MTEEMSIRIKIVVGEYPKVEMNGKDITEHVVGYSIVHQPNTRPVVRIDLQPDELETTLIGCDVLMGRQVTGKSHTEEPHLKRDSPLVVKKNPT